MNYFVAFGGILIVNYLSDCSVYLSSYICRVGARPHRNLSIREALGQMLKDGKILLLVTANGPQFNRYSVGFAAIQI